MSFHALAINGLKTLDCRVFGENCSGSKQADMTDAASDSKASDSLSEKFKVDKKYDKKSTYPPPADGLYVRFLCKVKLWRKPCLRPGPLRVLWGIWRLQRVQGFAKK